MKIRNLFLVLICLSLLNACIKDKEKKQKPVEKIAISNNGVSINYDMCGEGDTTLLFVHGWCINHSYWEAQVKEFCPRYRVVSIDLPGYGESGFNRNSWAIEDFASDVGTVIDALDLDKVILIGHSMSGDICLETARKHTKEVIALVGVDNFKDVGIILGDQEQADINNFFAMLQENFSEVAPAYAEGSLFHPSTDSSIIERVKADFAEARPEVAVPNLISLFAYSAREPKRLSGLEQSLYLINSDATPTNIDGLDKSGVDYTLLEIASTGHYPMIEKPTEFNQLLIKALRLISSKK